MNLFFKQAQLQSLFKEANDLGFRLEVHAIGDRAAEEVVSGFEAVGIPPEKRPILTHCQVRNTVRLKHLFNKSGT